MQVTKKGPSRIMQRQVLNKQYYPLPEILKVVLRVHLAELLHQLVVVAELRALVKKLSYVHGPLPFFA